MKVILKQTVPKVGKEGTVVNVADGFARNFLFPRGLAYLADKKQIEALNKRNERVAAKTAGLKADAEALKAKIEGSIIRLPGQVGAIQGKLYGAITAQDVTDAIKEQLGLSLEKEERRSRRADSPTGRVRRRTRPSPRRRREHHRRRLRPERTGSSRSGCTCRRSSGRVSS